MQRDYSEHRQYRAQQIETVLLGRPSHGQPHRDKNDRQEQEWGPELPHPGAMRHSFFSLLLVLLDVSYRSCESHVASYLTTKLQWADRQDCPEL